MLDDCGPNGFKRDFKRMGNTSGWVKFGKENWVIARPFILGAEKMGYCTDVNLLMTNWGCEPLV